MSEAMRVPVRKCLKQDLIWFGENFCRHNHTYLEHYSCFLAEKPDTAPMHEKVGVFDIETTNLPANWSHMLAWCVKESGVPIIHSDLVVRKEARDKDDRRIVKSAVEEIVKYDRIITWYGAKFDIPYVRSRALYHGIDFPAFRDIYHTDLYYVARSKLRLHSNRLGSVCQFFGIPAKNHPMTPELNRLCGSGDEEALKTILTHCEEDVESTDTVYFKLLKHTLLTKRSI